MKLSLACLAVAAAAPLAAAAPSSTGQLSFANALNPATSGFSSWLSSSIQHALSPILGSSDDATWATHNHDSDKTIYDVIAERREFRQLFKAVNYSSDSTKALLKGSTPLTIFAPVNQKHHHHGGDDHDELALAAQGPHIKGGLSQGLVSWNMVNRKIEKFEDSMTTSDDDDDEKERKRKALAAFIDAVLAYHLVLSDEPLTANELIQNSTVSSRLSIEGKAADTIGHLNDGLPLRIRVGKSLIPRPGVYLNFYSRIIKADVKVSNGILHVVDYPLFQFPSILAGLFATQPEFSTLTTGLLKTMSAGYFALPPPHHPRGGHEGDDDGSKQDSGEHHHDHEGEDRSHPHYHHHGFSNRKGTIGSTLFAPSNAAWDKLPWGFRAYLFSPWGEELLGKVLMLHSLPDDIFYADSVHHITNQTHGHGVQGEVEYIDDFSDLTHIFDKGDNIPKHAEKTKYVFDSVLPKLKGNDTDPVPKPDQEREKVYVNVYRYHLLPGGRGPLQTRVTAQGVPVLFQDVVNLNGATHVINDFIKPAEHPHHGVWAEVARQAEAFGYGSVDLVEEMGKW